MQKLENLEKNYCEIKNNFIEEIKKKIYHIK